MKASGVLLAALLVVAAWLPAPAALAETAKAGVVRYMSATKVECHDWNRRKPKPCPLSKAGEAIAIAVGQFPGEEPRYAVAFIDHEDGDGGNMVLRLVAVFVEDKGRWRFLRRVEEGYGSDPRDFAFLAGGRFDYTATTMRDNDPRCCPSGTERLSLLIGPAAVSAASTPATGGAAASAPVAARDAAIEGPFSYPSEYIPPKLTACAENLDTRETFCSTKQVARKGKRPSTRYRIDVPAGRYHVYATLPPDAEEYAYYKDYRAYHSQFTTCGHQLGCASHTPVEVRVEAGKTAAGIEPGDWYAK